jgi:hypothetical protein
LGLKKIIISIVLCISFLMPLHSNAETEQNYLVYDSKANIQEMMKILRLQRIRCCTND